MNFGDRDFLVRLDKGLEKVLNFDSGPIFELAAETGVTQAEWVRQQHMAAWTKAPEEWELLRPLPWTPSDGIRLDTLRQLDERRDNPEHRIVLIGCDAKRTIEELNRFEAATIGSRWIVDEWLMVRPAPLGWRWTYEWFGDHGNWVLDYEEDVEAYVAGLQQRITERIVAAVSSPRVPYDDAGIELIANEIAGVLRDEDA